MKHLLSEAAAVNSIKEFLLSSSNETLVHCLAQCESGLLALQNEKKAILAVLADREREATREEKRKLLELQKTFVWIPREDRELAAAGETFEAFKRAFGGDERAAKAAARSLNEVSLSDL